MEMPEVELELSLPASVVGHRTALQRSVTGGVHSLASLRCEEAAEADLVWPSKLKEETIF